MSHSEPSTTYPNRTDGKAFFFSPHAGKSFYFDLSALNWNFSYRDGNAGGRHILDGTFYYNKKFFEQKPEHPIEADFLVKAERTGSLSAHLKFYAPGSKGETDLLGEFYANDPDNIVAGFEGRERRLTGKWNAVHHDKLEDRLRKKYENREADADALFYKSGAGLPSLHLTAKTLGWEFISVRGVDPPTDPGLAGKLFYNKGFFDGEQPDPIDADFLVEQGEEDGRYVLITFYKPGKDNKELLGEFLAKDSEDKSKDLLNQRKPGQWKRLPALDLVAEMRKKYKQEQISDALLYKGSEDPPLQSFRLEVFRQKWEFWDNTFAIGHRLPGNLFYNDPILEDNDAKPIKATYRIERKRGKPGYYALVKFYAPGSNSAVWGEFLALDPADRAGKAGLLDKDLNGEWKKTDYSLLAPINAVKQEASTKITLSSLGPSAEMACKTDDKIYGDAFNVKGTLFSKTPANYGDFVRWYSDRAVLYKDATAEDFISFFFPDDLKHTIGSQEDLEMKVTWKFA